MSVDLEDRLREMYAAVTAQTVVDDPVSQTVDGSVAAAPPSNRPRLLALAVVAAVLIGAVVFIAVQSRSAAPAVVPEPPAATGDRMFALPGFTRLDGFGLDGTRIATLGDVIALGWVDGFPGVPDMSTTDEVSAVRWTGANGASITMLSAAARGLVPATGTSTSALLNGAVAEVSDANGSTIAAWREPKGPLIGVQVTAGGIDAQLRWLFANVWTVDRTLFDIATSHAGFLTSASSSSFAGFDPWRPPGPDFGVRIRMEGSAQNGLRVTTGIDGGMSYGDAAMCEARTLPGSSDRRRVLLISNMAVQSFTVHPRDGDAFTVPAGQYPGSSRWRFTTVLLPEPPGSAASATVTCEGATP
jgi:hypothetical protein